MENKELKIVPPEGYEIDRENSTLECIKFKKKEDVWRRHSADSLVSGYYIGIGSDIMPTTVVQRNTPYSRNIFATKKQAKSARAMAQISQIMANDKRFGGPVTDVEWRDDDSPKYIIIRRGGTFYCEESNKFYLSKIDTFITYTGYYFLAFHTKEQRDLFLEENEDLIKDYLMID